MSRYTKAEKAESRENLLRWLKDGDTVYTILESVAPSGMSRTLRLVILLPDGPRYLTFNAARVMGYGVKRGKLGNDVINVRGCGMDMGFAVVDDLAHTLGLKLQHRWL